MGKHTEGPWTVVTIQGSKSVMVGCGEDGSNILLDMREHWRNRMDNARLISAAPDLLEALTTLTTLAEYQDGQCGYCGRRAPEVDLGEDGKRETICNICAYENAKAVIAKANGE